MLGLWRKRPEWLLGIVCALNADASFEKTITTLRGGHFADTIPHCFLVRFDGHMD